MFGNTQRVAEAVAAGIAAHMTVELIEVGAAPTQIGEDVGLLVVGGPTHAFGLSRQSTRKSAAEQAHGSVVSTGIGLREWLDTLRNGTHHVAAAAFDTHVKTRVPGSAARATQKQLRQRGFRIIAPAQSFYVHGTPGPLEEGELNRARRWGAAIVDEQAKR
jgi:hypothetical protein